MTLTVNDVRRALLAARTPPSTSIGEDPGRKPGHDNTAVLWRRPDGTWFVAWFERGSYLDDEVFDDEGAACAAFLRLLGLPAPAQDDR